MPSEFEASSSQPVDVFSGGMTALVPSRFDLDRPARFEAALTALRADPALANLLGPLRERLGETDRVFDVADVLNGSSDDIWTRVPVTRLLSTVADLHLELTSLLGRTHGPALELLRAARERGAVLAASPVLLFDEAKGSASVDQIGKACRWVNTRHRRIAGGRGPGWFDRLRGRIRIAGAVSRARLGSHAGFVDMRSVAEKYGRLLADAITTRQRELVTAAEGLVAEGGGARGKCETLTVEYAELDRSLRGEMLGRIRMATAELLGNDYAPELRPAASASVLATDLDRRPYLTDAYHDLGALIGSTEGGSIGISGPRGSGKTMAIRHLCATRGADAAGEQSTAGASRLGFVVGAPVAYEAKDFIVHLHRELCSAILGTHVVSPNPVVPDDRSTGWLRPAPSAAVAGAGAAIAFAVAVTLGLVTLAGSSTRVGQWLLVAAALLAAICGVLVALPTVVARGGGLTLIRGEMRAVENWDSGADAALNRRLTVHRIVRAVFTLAGMLAGVGGVLEITEVGSARALPILIGTGLVLLGAAGIVLARSTGLRSLERAVRRHRELSGDTRSAGRRRVARDARAQPGLQNPALRSTAWAHLGYLDFLVSYTADSSATAKAGAAGAVPVGVEGKLGRGTSWAARPRSLPQIVASFQHLLAETAEHTQVVIGIDELDKMRSADDVQQFLNELKGVFGVRNTWFLVSVSEDAAAAFERRGAPFRDVFDSSFNDIVALKPLTLEDSRRLIVQELGVWTAPFVALCHILSGGLPRDLLRVARAVLALPAPDSSIGLSALCEHLVERDVRGRLGALRHELNAFPHRDPALALYAHLARLDRAPRTSADLRGQADMLLAWVQEPRQQVEAADAPTVVQLAREAAANLVLAAAVTEFFAECYDPGHMRAEEAAGGLVEALTLARRVLTVNPALALSVLGHDGTGSTVSPSPRPAPAPHAPS